MTDKLTQFPVKCKQCNREIPEGTVYYSHPKLGFVCMYCPAFSDGRIKANEDGTFTDTEEVTDHDSNRMIEKLSDQEISDALELCERASSGPWYVDHNHISSDEDIVCDYITAPENREFIAASRTLLPRALKEIQELRDGPPPCQSYEAECEELGRLCENLGIDCSCCYDKSDLMRLIKRKFEKAQADREKLKRKIEWYATHRGLNAPYDEDDIEEINLSGKLQKVRGKIARQALKDVGEGG